MYKRKNNIAKRERVTTRIIKIFILMMSFLISGCINESKTENKDISQNNNVKVTGITIADKTIKLEAGTSTKIAINVLPENATNKEVGWKSTNTSAAIILNGIVTGISNGNTSIIVTTNDGNFSEIINVSVSTATISSINLFSDKTQIKSNNIDAVTFYTKVYDQFDRELKGVTLNYYSNGKSLSSNILNTTTSGIYKVKAKYNNIESNEISISAVEKIIFYESEPNDNFDSATEIQYDADCYGECYKYDQEERPQDDCYKFTAIGSKTKIVFNSLEDGNSHFKFVIFDKKTKTGFVTDTLFDKSSSTLVFDSMPGKEYIIGVCAPCYITNFGGKYCFNIAVPSYNSLYMQSIYRMALPCK